MKITIDKVELTTALDVVSKAAPVVKSTLPILEGVLLNAESEKLYLTCNNLETSIKYTVDCEVSESGSVVVDMKMFSDIIKKMPTGGIDIQADGNKVIIGTGKTRMEIRTMEGNFPSMPEMKEGMEFEVDQESLRAAINGVAFTMSDDDIYPTLTGILMDIKDGVMNVVATDRFTLAIREILTDVPDARILPKGKHFESVARILDSGKVRISYDANNVVVSTDKFKMHLRIIDGEYTDYRRYTPREFGTTAKVFVKEFRQVLDRAELLMWKDEKGRLHGSVSISLCNDEIRVKMNEDSGTLDERLTTDMDGDKITIKFNPVKLNSCFKKIEDEEVVLKFTGQFGPCIMAPVEGEKFLYMVLPLR